MPERRDPRIPASSAADLAVLRIAVASMILLCADTWRGPSLATELSGYQPGSLRVPLGVGWLFEAVGVSPWLAHLCRVGVITGAILGLLGVWARVGFGIVCVCGLYLLALPGFLGPRHTHHLLWLAALLALSPCADAWTVRGRGSPAHGTAYALPLRTVWVLLGVIYFFPGLWKVLEVGPAWFTGEHLRGQLYWKWAQSWDHPRLRLDLIPGLLATAATVVVAFELSFGALVWHPRLRRWAIGAGLAFHAGTALVLDIHFSSLWICYVVFWPWSAERNPGPERRATGAARTGLALLTAGAVVAGASGHERSWPFAAYPSFATPAAATMPSLAVCAVGPSGTERPLPLTLLIDPEPDAWARLWRLAGLGGPVDAGALEDFWAQARTREGVSEALADAVEVRFYRAALEVAPDRLGAPAALQQRLHTMTLRPATGPAEQSPAP